MSQIHCHNFHDTDGQCCDDECVLAPRPQPVMPNANLSLWHLAGLTVALFSIFGWGTYLLERELAQRAPITIAEGVTP